ncbi:ribose-phosphate pyrophosphokinase 1-like isoform X2 [Rosa rugosa]|uniref:ribose-phosphate pyrophosphokinase 1-like isoform X2 n=1 Tax=Rosa rugosa TaxID=74645 RepID=UPI002B414F91|nr:ribose-phosphate pyrophosphokinase 1-like isoform X2 [Rosa rugosa]
MASLLLLPIVEISHPARKPYCLAELTGQPSCSTELTVTRDVINHSGYSNGKLPHKACQRNEKVAISLGHDSKVMNLIGDVKGKVAVMVDDMIDIAGNEHTVIILRM